MEEIYAAHSNKLKALANKARLDMVRITPIPYSPSAKAAYAREVTSLNSKLNIALKNAPLERQAQVIANAQVALRRRANPDMDDADIKKIQSKELAKARARTGAGKNMVVPTAEEWNAIQAGAISTSKLRSILTNAKPEVIKELATPITRPTVTTAMASRARSMADIGYSAAEIADHLGISTSTLSTALYGE